MAMLKGVVSFIENSNKEVIVYNGKVYKEVNRDAQAEDIVKMLEDDVDLEKDCFYEVKNDWSDSPVILDAEDDERYVGIWNPKVYGLVNSEESNDSQYKVGDKVVLVEHAATCGFDLGDICTIQEVGIRRDYFYKITNGSCSGYASDRHIKPCNLKFNIGDTVVVVDDEAEHDLPIGTITTISRIDYQDEEMPYKEIDGWWLAENDLRLVSESDLQWKKLGRRVGEFRNGDVVRFLQRTGTKEYPINSLAIIDHVSLDSNYYTFGCGNEYEGNLSWIELVAPAESVVKLSA